MTATSYGVIFLDLIVLVISLDRKLVLVISLERKIDNRYILEITFLILF